MFRLKEMNNDLHFTFFATAGYYPIDGIGRCHRARKQITQSKTQGHRQEESDLRLLSSVDRINQVRTVLDSRPMSLDYILSS